MQRILVVLLFALPFAGLFSQNERIRQLEADLIGASGSTRVETLISLSDAHMAAGDFNKGYKLAGEARELAKKIGQAELQALALNREGKALMNTEKRKLFGGKEKPGPRFRESNRILLASRSGNKALALENLELLRLLAVQSGRNEDVVSIDNEIARLNGEPVAAANTPKPPEAPLTRDELRQELDNVIAREISKLQTPKPGAVGKNSDQLKRENEALLAKMAAQEAAISQMNEQQLKDQLLIQMQRKMVDSLITRGYIDSLATVNYDLALREEQTTRELYGALALVFLLLAGGSTFSFVRARQHAKLLKEKNKIIRMEQERSENLLLNILPALVADELKKRGRTDARYFDDVSVLFADFVSFSKIAEKLAPQQLVSDLDTCFQEFDRIINKYGLEKIKTIGDAYMCAGGLPEGGGSRLRDMVAAAFEMQKWLGEWNAQRDISGLPRYDARIGIHRGPVVAGVVGSKKFAFDIWGDTVNIAARIEQAGEGGKINISGEVYEIVKEYFSCEYRGKIPAKNKGEIDMYFVG